MPLRQQGLCRPGSLSVIAVAHTFVFTFRCAPQIDQPGRAVPEKEGRAWAQARGYMCASLALFVCCCCLTHAVSNCQVR